MSTPQRRSFRSEARQGATERPSALMQWWGVAAMVDFNIKEWLTSSSAQRSISSTSRRLGERGVLGYQRDGILLVIFNNKVLTIVFTGLGEPLQLQQNVGGGKDQEGRSERGSTCSMLLPGFRSSRSSATPTSPGTAVKPLEYQV